MKIVSYQRSVAWRIYFWGILQYGLAIILSTAYLVKVHKKDTSVTKETIVDNLIVTDQKNPVIVHEYQPSSLI